MWDKFEELASIAEFELYEEERRMFKQEIIKQRSFHELLADTRKLLHQKFSDPNDSSEFTDMVRSILQKGIIYQKLSDKQKNVLASFILKYGDEEEDE
jgi:hypothetical protein